MAVHYVCRHCKTNIGSLSGQAAETARLGFHFLTPEERSDIIAYNPDGNVTVKIVCDYCREALEANPELLLVTNPLQ
ncbi:anti-sigma-F factor Fin family protein [Paenibacillus sp. IB182496]|uniref:Anti-sigma-F factor Fin family protein n=1 Tax=Paenibacillus sabuli TaxID=2772509 RepID=A0A927GUM1_9BACL|nr:anti-sigma-F factor Fin family protein [Paenibacillus sabuli]MBD2848310.1 anti-sigma-F factor Fin family protein [Paenibacillus sabuli]